MVLVKHLPWKVSGRMGNRALWEAPRTVSHLELEAQGTQSIRVYMEVSKRDTAASVIRLSSLIPGLRHHWTSVHWPNLL